MKWGKYMNKKGYMLLAVVLFIMGLFVACGNEEKKENIKAFVKEYDTVNNTLKIDKIEWITQNDAERIEELKLDANLDFPNGFYIYNPDETTKFYPVNSETLFFVNNLEDAAVPLYVEKNEFNSYLEKSFGLFNIEIINGEIKEVAEQYVP